MTNISEYSARYVERFGFHLVPIEPGRKFPLTNDWGNNTLSTPDGARAFYENHTDWNMGLALGPSGMCSLDIDCEESFRSLLDEFGIDLADLAVYPTIQGSAKGRRIMFRLPEGEDLKYAKLNWRREDDPKKQYTVFELRSACDGKQRQDVLPPSMHPDTGKPYRWLVNPPTSLDEWPEPPEWLLAIWEAWERFKPQLVAACPWAPEVEQAPVNPRHKERTDEQGVNVIDDYLSRVSLEEALKQYGYKRITSKRWLSPHSGTGLPGVTMFSGGNSCWVHHASDPLCSEDTGRPVNAFDLYCEYEYGGDASKAVKAIAEELGLGRRQRHVTEAAQAVFNAGMPPPMPIDEIPDDYIEQQTEERARAVTEDPEPSKAPFKALGYDGDRYFYLPRGTEQISEVRRGSHTSAAEMMSMASLEWWEMAFPKPKGGVDWQMAASWCMRACELRGVYSARHVRGRGSWYDDKRSVLHLGDRLIVDGVATSISDHQSRYIYTRQAPMESTIDASAATAHQAREVGELFNHLNWSKPVQGWLAAGWTVLAPICGALKWRPHIYLTAQRGAGKSYTQDNLMRPLLGQTAMIVQGSTTEAGIRQHLRQDARPILFDEAEAEQQAGQKRMQSVIELARQSSSDSSAEIVKGTATGGGMAFRMRSMFLLGAINVALTQAADESRFSVLTLLPPDRSPESAASFAEFDLRVGNTLTEDFCASVRARTYSLMPVIRDNAKVMAQAVAERMGSQRIGDQIGTLLAGHASLYRDDVLTIEEAREYISSIDLEDAKEAEEVSDEESCLNAILQAHVVYDGGQAASRLQLSELVMAASGRGGSVPGTPYEVNAVLQRYGMMVRQDRLLVANKHTELSRILRDTPWAAGWQRILKRMEGACAAIEVVRFAGTRSRAVSIPISSII